MSTFQITNPTLGTDFEMAIINSERKLISAIGIIGGTKEEPLSIGNSCFRQEDGVAAE